MIRHSHPNPCGTEPDPLHLEQCADCIDYGHVWLPRPGRGWCCDRCGTALARDDAVLGGEGR